MKQNKPINLDNLEFEAKFNEDGHGYVYLKKGEIKMNKKYDVDDKLVGILDNENDRIDLENGWGYVQFQHGPEKGNGKNGLSFQSFIGFAKMRLEYLDKLHPCEENKAAIEHLDIVDTLMSHRYRDRVDRGVEGKDED